MVLKKALAHDGLSRGLHETVRSIEKGQAQLCIIASDCDNPDLGKLTQALCSEHGVSLLSVPESKQLGQWAGVRLEPLLRCRELSSSYVMKSTIA